MRFKRTLVWRVLVPAVAIATVTAACSSGGGSSSSSSKPAKAGGTLVIGAEQEPSCMDWLGSCSGSAWGTWIAQLETIPYAFRDAPTGKENGGDLKEVIGPVLASEPKLETTPVQKITYQIAPAAVWSDGVPITCDDFAYTVDQQQHGTDLYDPTGYTDIAKVSCEGADKKTVVVTWPKGKVYANWTSLFSGATGILPSHILKGKDRAKAMTDGYTWSGGPWIATWHKGQDMTLVPNPKFWGKKPLADKVVFKFISDTSAEFLDIKSGQVDAIYPQPQVDVVQSIAGGGLSGLKTVYNSNTAAVEGIFFNNGTFPFNSQKVRQAVSYAIDREAIVKKLFGPLGVEQPSNSFNPYAVKDYSDQNSFANYSLNLGKVNQLMTEDGWTKGSDGIWTKGGKRASFTTSTTTGNKRRSLTEQVLQTQLKTAGFEVKISDQKPDDLYPAMGQGKFQMVLVGSGLTSLTPGLCSVFCSSAIPTEANGGNGNNVTRTDVPGLDKQLNIVDGSLDNEARMAAAKSGDQMIAESATSLPLDPLPDILIWNPKKIAGPIQDNSIESMFWNIDQWGAPS